MHIRLIQKNVSQTDLTPYIEEAIADDVDLICFPELATTGCLYTVRPIESAQPIESVRPIEKLSDQLEQFQKYPISILTGLPYYRENDLFNAALLHLQEADYLYHKVNLFEPMNEAKVYRAGNTTGIFRTELLGKVGVAICYDIRFDGVFDEMAKDRIEKLFIIAAFPIVRIDDWRRLLIERAKRTNATVFGINAVGDDGTNRFGGNSMAVMPDGTILAEADRQSETSLDIEL